MVDGTTHYPKEIAGAIIAVMRSLGTLAKGNENKFDKYNYASIDDFIQFVRGHCIDAGLFITMSEATEPKLVDVQKKDGKPMAMWWGQYSFTLGHESGQGYGPILKTVMVQASGAQSAGSAQSYAMKQFMRSQFLIPTGDGDDPDKEKVEISAQGQNETDLQRKAGRIRREILKAFNADDLDLAWSDNSVTIDEIKRVSDTAYDFLNGEFERRKREFEAVDNTPLRAG